MDGRSLSPAGDPLRVFIARKEAGGVRRLSMEAVERGRLVAASIQIDGTGLSDLRIVREVARLYALATLSAYGVRDRSFLTAAAEYLSSGVGPGDDREDATEAAAAPTLDLSAQPESLGRLYVEEFARSTGGPATLRAVWEKAAETGQDVLPLLLKAYSDSTREPDSQLLLRFASRLYTTLEPEAAPSRIGLLDLQTGGLDASAPAAFTLRHRSYLPASDSPAALRMTVAGRPERSGVRRRAVPRQRAPPGRRLLRARRGPRDSSGGCRPRGLAGRRVRGRRRLGPFESPSKAWPGFPIAAS